jgi:DNA-binding transcriptional regulator YiaG
MLELPPTEVKRIREGLDLTRDELAEKLGVSSWTVRSWEYSQRPCNGPAAILLQKLGAGVPKDAGDA